MDPNNYWKKPLTTAELLDEIERLDEDDILPSNIYILPPNNDCVETDEDSGDEDCNDPDRLNRHQLQAAAEVDVTDFVQSDPEECDTEEKQTNDKGKKRKRTSKKVKKVKRKWSKHNDFEVINDKNEKSGFATIYLPPISLSSESDAVDFFELFLSPSIVEHIVKHTVMYANQKNSRLELGSNEMYTFLGILYLSGYVPVPRRRMFWETLEDTHNNLVANSMRRNRFEEIFRYIHVADNNNLPKNDKVGKLRPLIEMINDNCFRYAPMTPTLSIDESMIPYFGRHGCKQYIKGKPIRFGYKAWVLATTSGYCVNLDIYQGKNERTTESDGNIKYGVGESIVLMFAHFLSESFKDLRFSLYFDNYFNSVKLMEKLQEMDFGATGTVRRDRMENCPLTAKNEMKRKARGSYESLLTEDKKIIAVQWNDNNIVNLLSNEFGIEPIQKARRYSAAAKTKVDIIQPNVIKKYNTYMGGVDLFDGHIAAYRIGLRGKKWYVPILFYLFDVCMSNAWVLARQFGYKHDNLYFRRMVVLSLLKKYGQPPCVPGPSRSSIIPESLKLSGQHLIICGQPRRRCQLCKNKTVKACQRCNIPLHDKCFEEYHK